MEHIENDEGPPMRMARKISVPAAKPSQDKRYDGYNHWPNIDKLKNPHVSFGRLLIEIKNKMHKM